MLAAKAAGLSVLPPYVVPGRALVVRHGDVEIAGAVERIAQSRSSAVVVARLEDIPVEHGAPLDRPLDAGTVVELTFADPGRGLLVLEALVLPGGGQLVHCEVTGSGTRVEQRRSFARTRVGVEVVVLLPGGAIKARSLDLSGGGVRVQLPVGAVGMTPGQRAAAVLVLPNEARVPVLVRCVGVEADVARLQFLDLTPLSEQRLCKYVLDVERKRRAQDAQAAGSRN